MKRSILFIALVVALFALVACAAPPVAAPSDGAGEAADSEAMAEEVTLRYLMWDPSFEETEQIMVDKFEAANPGVTVDFQTIGTPDYWTKVEALSAASDLPCVFNMSAGFVDQWISDGLLYNIQPYVDADINPDEYFTGVFDVTRDKNSGRHARLPLRLRRDGSLLQQGRL